VDAQRQVEHRRQFEAGFTAPASLERAAPRGRKEDMGITEMNETTIRPGQLTGGYAHHGTGSKEKVDKSFGNVLSDVVGEINNQQIAADEAIARVELDDSASIHEAIIAMEKASISFRTMMQVRNKIIEAYQEVMRMQV
jgi:flagellar hook-basal body complex protein FliE